MPWDLAATGSGGGTAALAVAANAFANLAHHARAGTVK